MQCRRARRCHRVFPVRSFVRTFVLTPRGAVCFAVPPGDVSSALAVPGAEGVVVLVPVLGEEAADADLADFGDHLALGELAEL